MKDKLIKNRKLILGIVLLLIALLVFFNVYQKEKKAYESEVQQMNMLITMLEKNIQENLKYAAIQDELDGLIEEVQEKRLELYESFPVELKEEDQIMYVLYLETLFRKEINFSFSTAQPIAMLSAGELQALSLTVNYETTYDGFKKMVNYLATDERITSVHYASIEYDQKTNKVTGEITLLLYLIDSDLKDYESPDVKVPPVDKNNIFQ